MSAGWVDPDNGGDDPWGAKDEPPSKPVPPRKPLNGLWSGVDVPAPAPAPTKCHECKSENVLVRKHDGATWCLDCQAALLPLPPGLVNRPGFWFL